MQPMGAARGNEEKIKVKEMAERASENGRGRR